jgi:hypothetical protein
MVHLPQGFRNAVADAPCADGTKTPGADCLFPVELFGRQAGTKKLSAIHASVTFGARDHDNVLAQMAINWLLEQGSNLQALRHLINRQARLPIPPSRIREFAQGSGTIAT